MNPEISRKDAEDVVGLGEVVLFYLREAERYLYSAKKWGIADFWVYCVLGLYKQEQMSKASECLQNANQNLRLLQNRLKEVQLNTDLYIGVQDFLMFADWFFDGIVSGIMVQRKIAKTREKVASTYIQVERIVDTFRKVYE